MTVTTPTLSADAKTKIDQILQSAVDSKEIPASTFAVATADLNAEPVYFKASGERVFGSPDKGQINEDTVLQLMSMTKLVVTVAALQLVAAGKLTLDDPEIINKHLPELTSLKIIKSADDAGTDRTKPITLRHLLTHTNGTGYDVMVPLLGEWAKKHSHPGVFASNATVQTFELPLIFEPGTAWNYSLGLDWGGILIERVTGQSLDSYFKENIFKPLGADSLTFVPTEKHYERLQQVVTRDAEKKLTVFPGIRETAPEKVKGQASGGAGLYGTARDYLRFLQGILRSAQPGGILPPEYTELIFSNQLPKAPEGTFKGQYEFAALIPHIDPALVANGGLSHSLGGYLTTQDSKWGRKAGSDFWEGESAAVASVVAMASTTWYTLTHRHLQDVLLDGPQDGHRGHVLDAVLQLWRPDRPPGEGVQPARAGAVRRSAVGCLRSSSVGVPLPRPMSLGISSSS